MATTTWTYDEIRAALELREREGLSWQRVSDRTGHPVSRLRYVARRLAGEATEQSGAFVEVVEDRSGRFSRSKRGEYPGGRITIEFVDGTQVHCDPSVDESLLSSVLRAVAQSC